MDGTVTSSGSRSVSARPVELILMRQLASYLATPIFLVDADGTLVFYNEAAEELLGRGFEDLPEMDRDEWLLAFQPHELDGSPLSADDNPLPAALADGREHHRRLAITGLDGRERRIEVTAFPLVGQARRLAGAVAVFWPSEEP
jgi:PAS domain-containing protein